MEKNTGKLYKYINKVEDFWTKRNQLIKGAEDYKVACRWLQSILDDLDKGIVRACEKSMENGILMSGLKKLYYCILNYMIAFLHQHKLLVIMIKFH